MLRHAYGVLDVLDVLVFFGRCLRTVKLKHPKAHKAPESTVKTDQALPSTFPGITDAPPFIRYIFPQPLV